MLTTKEKFHLAISLLQEIQAELPNSRTSIKMVTNAFTGNSSIEQSGNGKNEPAYDETMMLSQGQACKFLRISNATLTGLCKKKKISFIQVNPPNGYRKFKMSELQDYLAKSTHRN